jgi:hypothetical protein
MDFVTIIYNNKTELNLMKLQAISMKYVDIKLINNIYIVYNDTGYYNINDVLPFYPENLRSKVNIVYNRDVDICFKDNMSEFPWHKQQILKLLLANIVKSKYYLILDGKNHFIKNITYSDYFNKNGFPKLFVWDPGPMIKYYYSCLDYFQIKDPYDFKNTKKCNIFLTTTPFLMCKQDVLEMIEYIVKKENDTFFNFFMKRFDSHTEFYLYITYLIFKNKIQFCDITSVNYSSIMGYDLGKWNSYEDNALPIINIPHIKIFGLHRNAISKGGNTFKQNMLTFYHLYYDDNTCEFIKNNILEF